MLVSYCFEKSLLYNIYNVSSSDNFLARDICTGYPCGCSKEEKEY
jgi:hypothetical protein